MARKGEKKRDETVSPRPPSAGLFICLSHHKGTSEHLRQTFHTSLAAFKSADYVSSD